MKTPRLRTQTSNTGISNEAPQQNQLLALLPVPELRRVIAVAEIVQLHFAQVLYQQDRLKRHVYFPIDSYISQISSLAGTPRLEVGLVGAEGMVGSSLLFDVPIAPLHTVVQGAGTALRVSAPHFLQLLTRNAVLRLVMQHYLYVRLSQLSQMAACTRFHTVEARLARWLLMTRDRAHADTFQMTHANMAFMLGVRRVGITEAASLFRKRNLIRYRRGSMAIVNGRGLEAASCECYARAEEVYGRHMGTALKL
jgi:CRP-like cAMP-binding protein